MLTWFKKKKTPLCDKCRDFDKGDGTFIEMCYPCQDIVSEESPSQFRRYVLYFHAVYMRMCNND